MLTPTHLKQVARIKRADVKMLFRIINTITSLFEDILLSYEVKLPKKTFDKLFLFLEEDLDGDTPAELCRQTGKFLLWLLSRNEFKGLLTEKEAREILSDALFLLRRRARPEKMSPNPDLDKKRAKKWFDIIASTLEVLLERLCDLPPEMEKAEE